jgi:hypothetical protein
MCKHNPKNDSRFIDPCMKELIENLNDLYPITTRACCCGHNRYKMSIIVELNGHDVHKPMIYMDLCSGIVIPRKVKFYKKDKKGFYFIPEVDKEKK